MTALPRKTSTTMPALGLAMILAIGLTGCGADDPAAPAAPVDPVDSGLPPIPTLADYGSLDAIPATSDTLVASIARWTGPFTPAIEDMHSAYSYYLNVELFGLEATYEGGTFEGWYHSRPPVVSFDGDLIDPVTLEADPFRDGPLRFILANGGESLSRPIALDPITTVQNADGTSSLSWTTEARVFRGGWTGETRILEIRIPADYVPTISGMPHLKRELYWKLSNINGGSHRVIQPGYTFTESTTYTTGVSETESYEFFWSLTTEVGGGYGPVSASVSASIGETFGTSLTVTEERSVTRTEEFTAPDDQPILVTRWHLMERYTFCDEHGGPLGQGGLRWTETPLVVPGENRVFIEPYGGQ